MSTEFTIDDKIQIDRNKEKYNELADAFEQRNAEFKELKKDVSEIKTDVKLMNRSIETLTVSFTKFSDASREESQRTKQDFEEAVNHFNEQDEQRKIDIAILKTGQKLCGIFIAVVILGTIGAMVKDKIKSNVSNTKSYSSIYAKKIKDKR